MKIIKQSWSFEEQINSFDGVRILEKIERAARTCYRTDYKGSDDFIRGLIKSGHHSTIEHASISVRIITDRGVTHEIVRHRLAAYSQESTRYCNYAGEKFGNEITVILPVWFYGVDYSKSRTVAIPDDFYEWREAMRQCETHYLNLLNSGQSPQQARSVLPNSLKTELVMTCNLREWRHFFTLRCAKAAHPQMRELAVSMLLGFKDAVPIIFDDIEYYKEMPI
jgi:thymidylate synthase (FAD)